MRQKIFALVIIVAFIMLLVNSVVSLINNGMNFFDVMILIICLLGLTDITVRFLRHKR